MKGFKATYNMKCKELTYEVGKTYNISSINICNHGLHYCKEMKDVLEYYDYNNTFILLEIEDLGNCITNGDKSVTNKMKVIRVIPKEEYTFEIPIVEYDSNNNLIHYKDSYGYEYWNGYDSNNNLIHYKTSYGYEEWKEWDSNNLIHHKDSSGSEYWNEYNSNNNLIHHKNSDGYEEWKEYDSNNNLIHYKNSSGVEYWKEYDSNNNLIHYKDSRGYEEWKEWDSNNNVIHYKDSRGYEWVITID